MPRRPAFRCPLLLALVLANLPFPARAAEVPAELIRAADLLKQRLVEAPALSPDGQWVVYVVRSIEPKPGARDDWTYATNLWLVPADGSAAPRQLTRSAAANTAPEWSPDGASIAFVRTVEKEKPQVYLLSRDGGEARPLTKCETGAGGPHWSPDGTKILFASTLTYDQVRAALEKRGAPAVPAWKTERPGRVANDTAIWSGKQSEANPEHPAPKADPDGTLAERREWLAQDEAAGNPRALDRLRFQSESDIDPELTFGHVFVQEAAEGAEAKDLTPGFTGYAAPRWLPDGRGIVAVGPARTDIHLDRSESTSLYRIDAAGGGVKLLAEMPAYTLGNPVPSPDGKLVALTATPGEIFSYGQSVVATVPASGGKPTLLTEKLDRSAGELAWSPDAKSIYFVAPANGAFPLYRADAGVAGEPERITAAPDEGVQAFAVGRSHLVAALTTPGNPSELYALGEPKGAAKALTAHNSGWIATRRLSAYEPHHFVNKDGLTIEYWTMKPTAFAAGKKYPLLLEIHGGPQAMWGPGETSMWFEFQYFAARGYAIVFSNPRGSGGYGYDFQHANFRDWGIGPASDILAAADFAAKESYVDTKRQVMTGGSYGGYMTGWIVGHDHRFKAAVAQRGVYDLATFFGEGNAWRLVPRAFGGYPWDPEVRTILARESPLTYVQSITTPLLLQHGDNDRRTGFVQSEMLFRSLKVMDRDVEEVRYPRATHEMSRSGEPRQRLDSLVRYEEFFRRYIGDN